MNVIITKIAFPDDLVFEGRSGQLIYPPTEFEYGEVLVYYNKTEVKVLVDYNGYIPFSSLVLELF